MVNPFANFLKSNLNPFKRRPDSVIGVDIGSSSIKVVQLSKRRGVAVLETYGEIALGPYSDLEIGQATRLPPEKLARALLDVITEAGVSSKIGGISIPFTSSFVTMIRMPILPTKQLDNMIPIEARKYIPVPIEEVSLDWFVVPEGDEAMFSDAEDIDDKERGDDTETAVSSNIPEYTSVLLVAIHNEILNVYQNIVTISELDVSFYEIEIFSSIRATIGQTLSPVAVLDIGAAHTKLYVVEYGVVKTSHIINRGSQDITLNLSRSLDMDVAHAEEYKRKEGIVGPDTVATEAMLLPVEHIFSEANRALLSFQRKHNRNIGRVILTGGGSVLKGLLPLASEKLETEVELGNPFAKTQAPAFLEEVLKQVGPEFSVAVGLALRKLQESS